MLTHTFKNENEFWKAVDGRHPDFETVCEQLENINDTTFQNKVIVKRVSDGIYFALILNVFQLTIRNCEHLTVKEVRLKRKIVEYWGE